MDSTDIGAIIFLLLLDIKIDIIMNGLQQEWGDQTILCGLWKTHVIFFLVILDLIYLSERIKYFVYFG